MIKKLIRKYTKKESVIAPDADTIKSDEQILREFVSKHGKKWVDRVLKNKI